MKIQNQSKAYLRLTSDQEGTRAIKEFSSEIINGDQSNREAHAAKVYFNLLMGTSFSRGNEDILLNSGLDYGYAVLRGYIARVCVGYGLNTQIGIHHKNEYNRFNLVDDLMEPLRPMIDIVAYESMKMFQLINEDLSHLGDIELTYAVSDVWDMVQKSNVVGNGQTSLEDKNNFELFTIF